MILIITALSIECNYADWHYAERHYAECHSAKEKAMARFNQFDEKIVIFQNKLACSKNVIRECF